jgi:DNA-binding transcriptional ArsR family regulator
MALMTPPVGAAELAELAGLLADHTRAAFCLALTDGRAWTAGELARHASVAPSTASEHLTRLIAGGLLTEARQGRHRYVRLANAHVAELLEDLLGRLGPIPERTGTLRLATASAAMARGRTCYDHFAGRLGVAITDAMTSKGLIEQADGFALTAAGAEWLGAALGADLAKLRSGRRPLIRSCLDWTERRPHLAGAAGAHLCRRFQDNEWVRRIGGGRAVRLTPAGETAVRELLGIDPATLA